MVEHVEDKETLDKLLAENKLVVIDFWAPWCGPCKKIAPVYETLADQEVHPQYKNVKFVKINVDDYDAAADDWKVLCLPTFVFVKDGAEDGEKVTGASETELRTRLDLFSVVAEE